jgi:hypothetical protein
MVSIVGIDPGLKGGLCLIKDRGVVNLSPMPLWGGEVDYEGVRDYLEKARPNRVIIERQIVITGQNLAASAKTMYSFGVLIGILISLRIPYEIVEAKTWQGIYKDVPCADTSAWKYSKETKQRSVGLAMYLYPDVSLIPTAASYKPSDGMAEALLLAHYGMLE